MGRTAIEKLPRDVRDQVEAWLREFLAGRLSLDAVMEKIDNQFGDQLGDEMPSRSALHRHSKKYAALAARLKESQEVTDLLVANVGPDVADGKGFQVLVQAFQSLAFNMLASMGPDDHLDPEELMQFARAIGSVASAQKTDTDRALKVRQVALKDAAAAAEKVAKSQGLSKETLAAIRAGILGVKTK